MEIKVLGTGCPNCKKTKAIVAEAVAELNVDADVVEVTDLAAILAYGVMSTPAVVINGDVVRSGGVPQKAQMIEMIRAAA